MRGSRETTLKEQCLVNQKLEVKVEGTIFRKALRQEVVSALNPWKARWLEWSGGLGGGGGEDETTQATQAMCGKVCILF